MSDATTASDATTGRAGDEGRVARTTVCCGRSWLTLGGVYIAMEGDECRDSDVIGRCRRMGRELWAANGKVFWNEELLKTAAEAINEALAKTSDGETVLDLVRITGGVIDAYTLAPNDEDEKRDRVRATIELETAPILAALRASDAARREAEETAKRLGEDVATLKNWVGLLAADIGSKDPSVFIALVNGTGPVCGVFTIKGMGSRLPVEPLDVEIIRKSPTAEAK